MIAQWRRLSRLRHDRRGIAMVEFAIVLPVALLMYVGGYQFMDGMACNRKVTMTARSVADLISRSSNNTIYKADVDTALNASTQTMYPYSSTNALVRVSEITIDGNGNSTVTWSDAINGQQPLTKNAPFALPAKLVVNNTSLIYAEVSYSYQPVASAFSFASSAKLNQTVYMSPRSFASISCQDC